MRRKRLKTAGYELDRRYLFIITGLIVLFFITVNCTADPGLIAAGEAAENSEPSSFIEHRLESSGVKPDQPDPVQAVLSDMLVADASDNISGAVLSSSTYSNNISLNLKDASLLDVLSLLAYKMDANIIYLEDPRTISITTENLPVMDTFQFILEKEGLDYIRSGRNYIVGERSRLQEDFKSRIYLTKKNLSHVTAQAMEGYLNELDIPVDILTVDANKKTIWIQGTPMALAKAGEIINMLDIAENADPEAAEEEGEELLARFKLYYVSAETMEEYISQMGLPVQVLTIDANRAVIWLQGTPLALERAGAMLRKLDIYENRDPDDWGPLIARFDLDYIPAEKIESYLSQMNIPVTGLTIDANQQAIWLQGDPSALELAGDFIKMIDLAENGSLAEGEEAVTRITLRYVSPASMESYIAKFGIPVTTLTVDANKKAIWIQGQPADLSRARDLIKILDIADNADLAEGEPVLTKRTLNYVTAAVMESYFSELGIPVKVLKSEQNDRIIWLQGTPGAQAKARELIEALDVPENAELPVGAPLLDQVSLTYISAEAMARYLSEMDIEVKTLTVDTNRKAIWLQGTTEALAQARELIAILDIADNADLEADDPPLTLIELEHITVGAMTGYLNELGISIQVLRTDEDQKIFWVQGSPGDIARARELIGLLDVVENADLLEGEAPLVRKDLAFVSSNAMARYFSELGLQVQTLTIDSNQTVIWLQGTPTDLIEAEEIIRKLDIAENADLEEGEPLLRRIELEYVSAEAMESYLIKIGTPVQIITVEANPYVIWLQGTLAALAKAEDTIEAFDIPENADLPEGEELLNKVYMKYVAASNMKGYLQTLISMPLTFLDIGENELALWIQGSPVALDKAYQLISTIDIKENAVFGFGGTRMIRMPVARAVGAEAEDELLALIELLSILLDGLRDGEPGWEYWDHSADGYPSIEVMAWDDPVIDHLDHNTIKMKISPDFANNPARQIRYLIAEGTPDNIELVNKMIEEIRGTKPSPLFVDYEEEEEEFGMTASQNSQDSTDSGTSQPPPPQQYFTVSLSAVPSEGGTLSGSGLFPEGSRVTVTATAAEGYSFVRWIDRGSEVSTSPSYTFTIYGSRTLEAVFVVDEPTNDLDEGENGES